MAIPDYQRIMLPLLKHVADKRDHSIGDIVDKLSKEFKLSEEEKKELLPSGQTFIFGSRVGWARTYLKKAGLLASPKRATVIITERGLDVLRQNPSQINVGLLRQFPEFVEFQSPKREDNGHATEVLLAESIEQTPEESIETAYQRIRKALAQEIITKILNKSPDFFEKLVVRLLVKIGYGGSIKDAGRAIGKSGDEGIDGTIKEDKLGLDVIYIQAKRWQPGNVIGRPEIHKFIGALAGQGAKKGIFITTSSFTKEALDFVPRNETKIALLDGEQLAQLMIDYNLGVTTQQTYELKEVDNDFFGE
jgi:restriction system protein